MDEVMSKKSSLALLFLLGMNPMSICSQESGSQKRVADILATLNKKEHLVVEVHGARKEKYREIRNEPVIPADVREYSGTYHVPDLDYSVTIKIGSGGEVFGTGSEAQRENAGRARRFVLKDVR